MDRRVSDIAYVVSEPGVDVPSEIRTPPLSFAVQTPWLVAGSGLARALRFAV